MASNLLRPETVESLFYLWRATKDERYREYGWLIFQAFQKHAKTPQGAYAAISVSFGLSRLLGPWSSQQAQLYHQLQGVMKGDQQMHACHLTTSRTLLGFLAWATQERSSRD